MFEDGTTDQLQTLSVRPMAWSCLAGGRIFSEDTDQMRRLRIVLSDLAEELSTSSIEHVIYAWLLKHPSNPVALLGTSNLSVLKRQYSL